MISYKDKKWMIMQPVYGGEWEPPDENLEWTNDCNVNLGRLLRAHGSHFSLNVDMSYDIYILIIFGYEHYEKELEFMRKVKANGSKVILAFSSDDRFLSGQGLLHPDGINYTDLCKEADMIWSGIPMNLRMYGRYQHKVVDVAIFLERLNFSLPYEERDIDILLSGSIFRGEQMLPFAIELMMMLKEKYPEKRIVYPTTYKDKIQIHYPEIEFVDPISYMSDKGLVPLLQKSKVYINPELRPNPGRAMIEAFYCRTPYVCSEWCFASKYFPDFTYNKMDMPYIIEQYEKILEVNRNELISKSELLAEQDYFENSIKNVMEKLYN